MKTTAEKVEEKAIIKVCPVCGSEMEKGFYIVSAHARAICKAKTV